VRLHLAQENLEAAIAWAEASGLGVEDELRYGVTKQHPSGSELDYLTFVRVLIARGRSAKESASCLDDAMQLLNRLYEFTQSGGRTARTLEVLLLQALVWQAQGNVEQALNVLEQALSLSQTGNYIRLFMDEGQSMLALLRCASLQGIYPKYVSRLLSAFDPVEEEADTTEKPPVRLQEQPLIEPLSKRELEMLHYLAKGFSNQVIANQLYVSLAAVKWHARNIYSKLAVNNRTQAVARARELRLLP